MSNSDRDPVHHTPQQAERLRETARHLLRIPRPRRVFETAAEVLNGLEKAFRD
jgi:hypothetical protein